MSAIKRCFHGRDKAGCYHCDLPHLFPFHTYKPGCWHRVSWEAVWSDNGWNMLESPCGQWTYKKRKLTATSESIEPK